MTDTTGNAVDLMAALQARDRLADLADELSAGRVLLDGAQIARTIRAAFAELDALHPKKAGAPTMSYSIPAHAKWCQPGDMQDKRYFLVRFDDPDRGDAVFTDEDEARQFYGRATISWNCWLFGTLPAQPERDGAIEALRSAFADAQYAPGDNQVTPAKIATFMNFIGTWLATTAPPSGAATSG